MQTGESAQYRGNGSGNGPRRHSCAPLPDRCLFVVRIKVERERQRLNDDGHGIGCPVIAERNVKEREDVVRQVRLELKNVAADQNCRQSECRRKPRPVRIRRKETAQSRRVKKHRDRKAGTEHQVEQPESRIIHRDHHIRNHRQDQRRPWTQ